MHDAEWQFVDLRPPGLIFRDDDLWNSRLYMFLDTKIGQHLYSLVQARFDRGFDPRSDHFEGRADEYLLRYMPFHDGRLNVQFGKFATVVGDWVPRHLSWDNPFINAPLPYENVTIITDQAAPPSPAAFLARRTSPDKKFIWVPMIWGPSYSTGGSVFGRVAKFDYAVEVKATSISSRPSAWDARHIGFDDPTVSGRVGFRPNSSWNLGASFSRGPYLLPAAEPTLPGGSDIGDFNQITIGHDISYARRHWQVWAEFFWSRFEVPNVGNADTWAYYIETKYKLTTRLFIAARWNQQFFGEVPNGAGGESRWDRDISRAELAFGYRFNRHWQGKVQYSYSHQNGPFQQGEQLVALQLTTKF